MASRSSTHDLPGTNCRTSSGIACCEMLPGLRLRLEDSRRTLVLASAVKVHEIINTGLIDGEFEHCAVARRHFESVDAVHRVGRIAAAIDSAEQNAGDVKR